MSHHFDWQPEQQDISDVHCFAGPSDDDGPRTVIGMNAWLARAHLLYGEWLRREGRRVDAREQLRTARDMFAATSMEAFAERARRELIATGEKVRKRSVETRDQLTPQEEQIALLARDGRTSPEIGAQLFLSERTVEWHLGKIFPKLGIGSRANCMPRWSARDSRTSRPSQRS